MPMDFARRRGPVVAACLLLLLAPAAPGRAGTVTLKNGTIYRGTVDTDDTIVSIFDGLTRIMLRDTKITGTSPEADPSYVVFRPQQPLEVHGGAMPAYALSIKATEWDKFGRREFEYVGPRSTKPIRMTQAINVLGPKQVQYRGVDGFWLGQSATSQVPKEVVLGLLAQVDQTDQEARLQVNQFLIQAEWYDEALKELDRLEKDFPETRDNVANARRLVHELRANARLGELKVREAAQQPRAVRSMLQTFPTDGAGPTVLVDVRNRLKEAEDRADDDKALAASIRAAADGLGDEDRKEIKNALVEMLDGLAEAPDAVRDRLAAFRRPPTADAAEPTAEVRFARALSSWVAGAEGMTDNLQGARALWDARDAIRRFLSTADAATHQSAVDTLMSLKLPDGKAAEPPGLDLAALTRIIRQMPPPLRDPRLEEAGKIRLLRVNDDPNPAEPTEYAIQLPPEYHPLRRYPAIVALRGSPESAVAWWAEEAARRGYIVLSPEYKLRGQSVDYRYTPSEHAAVILALRDAQRRFSIDSDRVFLGGQLVGAKMAWDVGLAHPDLFAGVAIVSGLPQKYPLAYKDNAAVVPLYIALGDLAPGEQPFIFPLAKQLIGRNYDVTYVEHYRRGLEDLPEERERIFEWMGHRRRDPAPKDEVKYATGRTCDNRFFGLVVEEWSRGRSMSAEAVDDLGKNLRPATVSLQVKGFGSLLLVKTDGVRKLDVWINPQQVDLAKKFEIRLNGRTAFKGQARPDLDALLEDLRLRGDRSQLYGVKMSFTLGGR